MTQPKSDLAYLRSEKAKAEQQLRYYKHREKILEHQIPELTRKARVHRLCTRAGMLESFLIAPEELTNDQVMELLKIAFRHGYTADAHGPCGSAPVSGVPEFSPGAGSSAAAVLLWLSRCGDRRDRFSVGSMASRSFSKVGCIRHFYWFVVHYTQSM